MALKTQLIMNLKHNIINLNNNCVGPIATWIRKEGPLIGGVCG